MYDVLWHFYSIVALKSLIQLDLQAVQLAGLSDPKYAQLETIGLSSRQGRAGNVAETVLRCSRCVWPNILLLKNVFTKPCHEWQDKWLKDVVNVRLGCHCTIDEY